MHASLGVFHPAFRSTYEADTSRRAFHASKCDDGLRNTCLEPPAAAWERIWEPFLTPTDRSSWTTWTSNRCVASPRSKPTIRTCRWIAGSCFGRVPKRRPNPCPRLLGRRKGRQCRVGSVESGPSARPWTCERTCVLLELQASIPKGANSRQSGRARPQGKLVA